MLHAGAEIIANARGEGLALGLGLRFFTGVLAVMLADFFGRAFGGDALVLLGVILLGIVALDAALFAVLVVFFVLAVLFVVLVIFVLFVIFVGLRFLAFGFFALRFGHVLGDGGGFFFGQVRMLFVKMLLAFLVSFVVARFVDFLAQLDGRRSGWFGVFFGAFFGALRSGRLVAESCDAFAGQRLEAGGGARSALAALEGRRSGTRSRFERPERLERRVRRFAVLGRLAGSGNFRNGSFRLGRRSGVHV